MALLDAPLGRAEAIVALGGDAPQRGEIAALLGDEPAALAWAATVARTMGWEAFLARLARWTIPATLPWRAEVEGAVAALGEEDRALLVTLAGCDAAFAWDVLEDVVPDVSVDAIVRLEEARMLRRGTRAGVVTFLVPFVVRAVLRAPADVRWREAWTRRAESLETYGPRAAASLVELGACLPLAARSIGNGHGIALWLAASDALFFGDALGFDAPAITQAVALADAAGDAEPRARTRLVAARCALERGDADAALALARAAHELGTSADTRAAADRGRAWAEVARGELEAAQASFTAARSHRDPRNEADAAAGLGIVALVGGRPEEARALLEESIAIHVVMRDTTREGAVRGMMELLPAATAEDEATLGAHAVDLRARGQHWREALALARLALAARARGDAATEGAHLRAAGAAALVARMPVSDLVRRLVERDESPILVTAEARTLSLAGETHDLGRHGPVRRVLWALACAHRDRPGAALTTLDVVAAGWPGEKMKHEAATLRVYTTIRRLRALGLDDVLVTRDDGYLLAPATKIAFAS